MKFDKILQKKYNLLNEQPPAELSDEPAAEAETPAEQETPVS